MDNSITIDGDTFLNTDWTETNINNYNSVTTIINNYESENGGITEEQLRQILEEFFKKWNEKPDGGGNDGGNGGGNGGGDNSGDDDNGGDDDNSGGLSVIINAINNVIDAVVSMIEGLFDSAMDTLDKLGTHTKRFSHFLTSAFEFIPPEIWAVIASGLTLMVIASVFRAFIK